MKRLNSEAHVSEHMHANWF